MADLLEDMLRPGGPDEESRVGVGLGEEALDRGLQLDERAERARLSQRSEASKNRSATGLLAEVRPYQGRRLRVGRLLAGSGELSGCVPTHHSP